MVWEGSAVKVISCVGGFSGDLVFGTAAYVWGPGVVVQVREGGGVGGHFDLAGLVAETLTCLYGHTTLGLRSAPRR